MLCTEGRTLLPSLALESFTLGEPVRGAVRTPHHDAHRRAGVLRIVRTRPGAHRTGCAPRGGGVRCVVPDATRRASPCVPRGVRVARLCGLVKAGNPAVQKRFAANDQ
jgi:hypothetical protein